MPDEAFVEFETAKPDRWRTLWSELAEMGVFSLRLSEDDGGIGLQGVDNDNGTEEDPNTAKWVLGGQSDIFGNASSFSDYILLPPDFDRLPTAVKEDSWGHIKASFAN